jgi:hypothetical protein
MNLHSELDPVLFKNDLGSPAKNINKKKPFTRLIVIVLLCLLIAGGIWASRQLIEKGEVEVPLPEIVATAITENLRLGEEGRLGPVRIIPGDRQLLDFMDDTPASGNVVGMLVIENGQRPIAVGLVSPPDQSAEVLAEEPVLGEIRQKILSGYDAVITIGFVNYLASYLAENYWPQGSHIAASRAPVSTATIDNLNRRYGLELTGFAATRTDSGRRDYFRDRNLVLNYAFTPSMITALTHLYADRFADQLAIFGKQQYRTRNGRNEQMTDDDVARMLRYYAEYTRALGAAFTAYAENPGVADAVHNLHAAQAASYEAATVMHQARYVLELTEEGSWRVSSLREAQANMEKSEREYQIAILELQRSKEAMANMMSRGLARNIDADSLIYIATWAARREPNAAPAMRSAAAATGFVGMVLDEKAEDIVRMSAEQTRDNDQY